MRTSMRWILGVVGAASLAACHASGVAPDTSSMGIQMRGRWVSQSAAWKDKNVGYSSYQGIAFGPGSAASIKRTTLNNPDPNVDYVPLMVPAGGNSPQVYAAVPEGRHEVTPPVSPSDDYFVNGRDLGPSVDRAPGTGGPAKLSSPQP